MTELHSRMGTVAFGPGQPTLLINDQLCLSTQGPGVVNELAMGKIDTFLDLAFRGHKAGINAVNIQIDHPDLDVPSLLPRIATAIHENVGCPIVLDSRDPVALDAALHALGPSKALINSVTAEPESLDAILPLAREHGAALVGMPIGEQHGMPKTAAGRLAEASVIIQAAARVGIPLEDIAMDAICLAASTIPDSLEVALETIRAFRAEWNITTILGIGNAGFGMPDRTRVDLAYLLAAVPWGLDAALVDPATPGLIESVRAIDFLSANDPFGRRYIQHYRSR